MNKDTSLLTIPPQRPATDDGYGIDLVAWIKILWKGRTALILSLLGFTFLGVFVASFSAVEFTARTVIVPQIQSKSSGLGGLSSLAAMAGFNLDAMQSGSSELSPMVYPQIVKSIPFQKAIMNTPLTWEGLANPASLLYYYDSIYKEKPLEVIQKYTLGLPAIILTWLKGNSNKTGDKIPEGGALISISEEEKNIGTILNKRLSLAVNSKEGYVTLTAIAPEALPAAQIAQRAQELLQFKVTEFKLNKARQNLTFIQGLFTEKEDDFLEAQSRLASFRDKNLNLGSAMAKTEEEKLQSAYQLAFSVYSELAKQLENAKIKVKEDTPTFSIIEPVSIPTERSKPKKSIIVVIWFLLGGIVGIGWVSGRHYLSDIKKKWAIREN